MESDEIDRLLKTGLVCAACKRHTEVPAFFNPAMIEKQKGKAKDPLLLSSLKSPAKDLLSNLIL